MFWLYLCGGGGRELRPVVNLDLQYMPSTIHSQFYSYRIYYPTPTGKLNRETSQGATPPPHASHNNHTESKGEVNYTGSTNTFSSGAALL